MRVPKLQGRKRGIQRTQVRELHARAQQCASNNGVGFQGSQRAHTGAAHLSMLRARSTARNGKPAGQSSADEGGDTSQRATAAATSR